MSNYEKIISSDHPTSNCEEMKITYRYRCETFDTCEEYLEVVTKSIRHSPHEIREFKVFIHERNARLYIEDRELDDLRKGTAYYRYGVHWTKLDDTKFIKDMSIANRDAQIQLLKERDEDKLINIIVIVVVAFVSSIITLALT